MTTLADLCPLQRVLLICIGASLVSAIARNSDRATALTTLAIAVFAMTLHTQQSTIPEALAQAGKSLTGGTTIPSGIAPTIDEVLRDVDIVVTGIVGQPNSYLSDDQREVYPDYPISNPIFLDASSLESVGD